MTKLVDKTLEVTDYLFEQAEIDSVDMSDFWSAFKPEHLPELDTKNFIDKLFLYAVNNHQFTLAKSLISNVDDEVILNSVKIFARQYDSEKLHFLYKNSAINTFDKLLVIKELALNNHFSILHQMKLNLDIFSKAGRCILLLHPEFPEYLQAFCPA